MPGVVDALRAGAGDVIVLGAGGKMGPSLARMIHRAFEELGRGDRVYAVSRFGNPDSRERLRATGLDVIACDLADREAVRQLPDAPTLFYMAGQKFGTAALPAATWGANVVVPAVVAERFRGSRIVAFSTGNVYPLTAADAGGSRESDPVGPVGEYGMSCLGRERVFEYHSLRDGTPLAIIRLNYAIDLRYGVLVDIARRIAAGEPVDLRMGHVNVIWQGDANAQAIQSLTYATSPPFVVNVTGPETVSVREAAERIARLMNRTARFTGAPGPDALLSDASMARELFGQPSVSTDLLIEWVAEWVSRGGAHLGKPTHFESRNGAF
jgi:nucleoside-diphosphate-sugar epimerase